MSPDRYEEGSFPRRLARLVAGLLAGAALVLGAGCHKASGPKEPEPAASIRLTSPAFKDGESIPKKYTADGENVSPPLRWEEPPRGAQSFALICEDPDAPGGTFYHWVLFNLPADARELKEGVPPTGELPDGARQGKNSFDKVGYGGPSPPEGKPHRYVFKLFALDRKLDLSAGATRDQLVTAMKGHALAGGQLTGKYGR